MTKSALKMFLRDLPNPLISRNVVDSCLALDLEGPLKNNSTTPITQDIKQNMIFIIWPFARSFSKVKITPLDE